MIKKISKSSYTIIGLFVAVSAMMTYSFTGAQNTWTAPPATPPQGNVEAPINVGPNAQIKAGSIGANVLLASSAVWSDEYCDRDGQNCLNTAAIYVCPYIDSSSTVEGDCGSTCVGQMGIATSCTDYEQYKQGSNDRRCRVRQTYQCVRLGETVPSEGRWWTGNWSRWAVVPPNPATCREYGVGRDTGSFRDYPCTREARTRAVQCRSVETNQQVNESSCSSSLGSDSIGKPTATESRTRPIVEVPEWTGQ